MNKNFVMRNIPNQSCHHDIFMCTQKYITYYECFVCFQNLRHGPKGSKGPMWRLLKLNSPEWKALSLGFFGCMCTGAIMPMFAIFYGEMFNVSYVKMVRSQTYEQ